LAGGLFPNRFLFNAPLLDGFLLSGFFLNAFLPDGFISSFGYF
jgi:hypothetical protein